MPHFGELQSRWHRAVRGVSFSLNSGGVILNVFMHYGGGQNMDPLFSSKQHGCQNVMDSRRQQIYMCVYCSSLQTDPHHPRQTHWAHLGSEGWQCPETVFVSSLRSSVSCVLPTHSQPKPATKNPVNTETMSQSLELCRSELLRWSF